MLVEAGLFINSSIHPSIHLFIAVIEFRNNLQDVKSLKS